jgi:hypothetical protein
MTPHGHEEKNMMLNIPYREAVGSILYAAITVRHEIAFIAGKIARFCENPGPIHCKAEKRVINNV